MYKVLLVDDEILIREKMAKKISWNDLGFELVAVCENGQEAIEVLERECVDVVLTDICMPYINGLELSRHIYEHDKSIKVVILSGYAEFEYAKQAMKYQVYSYLLKPITSEELSQVLLELCSMLDREHKERDFQNVYEDTYSLFRIQNLLQIAQGTLSSDLIHARLKEYKPEFYRESVRYSAGFLCIWEHLEAYRIERIEQELNYFSPKILAFRNLDNGIIIFAREESNVNMQSLWRRLADYICSFIWEQYRVLAGILVGVPVKYMDYYENVLYNQILGSQNSEGRKTYSVDLSMGASTVFLGREGFECCLGTGFENPARYDRMIYAKDADALHVNLFINSTVTWEEKGLELTQLTAYPEEETTYLTVDRASGKSAVIKFRVPAWTEGMTVKVNGKATDAVPADGYISVEKVWEAGDKIEVTIPMSLRLHVSRGNEHVVAFKYGPILLAGDLGSDMVRKIVAEDKDPAAFIDKTSDGLDFVIDGYLRPGDGSITLKPFYEFESEPHMAYWYLYTTEEYEMMPNVSGSFGDRMMEATIDFVTPAHLQSELDHNFRSEGSSQTGIHSPAANEFSTGSWRDVRNGMLQYDLKVDPDGDNYLVTMFWGSDTHPGDAKRIFDISAEDVVLQESYELNNNLPNQVEYLYLKIPRMLTEGKEKITVTYSAGAGYMAGGLFGIRTTSRPVGNIEWAAKIGSTSSELNYEGNWQVYNGSGPYENKETYTTDKGDSVSYTFTGSEYIRVSAKFDAAKSGAEVYLDGKKISVMSTSENKGTYEIAWESDYLNPYVEHTLRLVATEDFGFDYIQLGNETVKIGNLDADVEKVIGLIDGIGTVIKGDAACEERIKAAREAYDKLTDAQKGLVTNYELLEKAECEKIVLPYTDVEEYAWYYDSVVYNYYAGTMTGKSETTFAPDLPLKRAEFASIIHRMEGEETVEFIPEFPDITAKDWYAAPVLWAKANKIVSGYGDGTFGPNNNIVREQIAVMMHNYASAKGYDVSATDDLSAFVDAGEVSAYASPAMKWAVGSGIINGKYGGTRLDPFGDTTRAECAAIIMNFMEIYY